LAAINPKAKSNPAVLATALILSAPYSLHAKEKRAQIPSFVRLTQPKVAAQIIAQIIR
jgi:hypothetical protein